MNEAKQLVVFEHSNKKQNEFHDKVMLAVAKRNMFRYFFYGGAIRGGKTFVVLYILVKLAKLFPKSRWHVFRSSIPELEDTTIPSMEKLIGTTGKDFVWKRQKSNIHVVFSNGSKIFFKSQKIEDDPDLNWMLGLETNGIVLEQMEGLSEKLLQRAIERVGSWYIDPMPPPLILGTFNPTDTWVKKKIYDRWREDELPGDWYFQEALPDDNPFVTEDQWKNWDNLDPISKNQLIKGIWKFLTDAKTFAYAFDAKRTVIDVTKPEGKALMTPKKNLPLYIVFDFNVDPITAIACQHEGTNWAKVYKEYRLRNSDIFELCTRISTDWKDFYIVASGDASGRARSALTKGNRSFMKTVQILLRLPARRLQFPMSNPSVRNTRMLMNSLFHNHPAFYISSECLYLIEDLETVKVNDKGEIDKKKDAHKTHLLDALRYYQWNYWKKFLQVFN